MVAQELLEQGHEVHVVCCKDIFKNVPANAVRINSDEAHFHLSGFVNKQNFCYCPESSPRELNERPLHSKRVTMWCTVANCGAWGPYFFEEEDKAVSVTSVHPYFFEEEDKAISATSVYCVQMLQNVLKPKLQDLRENAMVWIQQDGVATHTAKNQWMFCKNSFAADLISLCGDIGWPAHLLVLCPYDYFLWGYIKAGVLSTDQQPLMN